jgi:hypothetical protein
MLATGILTDELGRSGGPEYLDGDERTRFRFAGLAPAFEPLFVLVFDIPHYNNRSMSPTTHTVSLGDLASDPLPQLH